MERRCIICGEQPASKFTYPHTLEQALKWQNMLATFVPVETLMHCCCVCNKHVNRKEATVPESPIDEERSVTFTDANAVHYFTDQRPETQLDCAQTDNFCQSQIDYQSNDNEQPSDQIYEQLRIRSTSGSDLNFRSKKQSALKNTNLKKNRTQLKGASTKKVCKPECNRYSSSKSSEPNLAMPRKRENSPARSGKNPQLESNSSSYGFPPKVCNKQVCPQRQPHQHQQEQHQICPGLRQCSNHNVCIQTSYEKPCMCDRGFRQKACGNLSQMNAGNSNMGNAPCGQCSPMETDRRPPVNVLIMGGSMVPSYYNDKNLRRRSSDISQICVLESDMTREGAVFPDIDEPNYSVCRQPAENAQNGAADSTDVLLLGTTPEKKCPCAELASGTSPKTKPPAAKLIQQAEKITSESIDKKGAKQLDELESLLAQQQQLQKSIQAKLNELQASTKVEKERVNAGTAQSNFNWPPYERVAPRVRVLRSMANYKTY